MTRSNKTEGDESTATLEGLLREIYHGVPHGLIPSMTELSSRALLLSGDTTESSQQAMLGAVTRIAHDPERLMTTRAMIGASPTKVTALETRTGGPRRLARDFNDFVGPVLNEAITGVGVLFEIALEGSLARAGYDVRPLTQWNRYQGKLARSVDKLVWVGGRPAIAIECKNRRAATSCSLTRTERQRLEKIAALGMVPVYVVPSSTARFRRIVGEYRGHVVDTNVFVVGSASLARRLSGIDTPWPVRTVDGSPGDLHLPRLAEDVVLESLQVVAEEWASAGELHLPRNVAGDSSKARRRLRAQAARELFAKTETLACLSCGRPLKRQQGNHWCSNAACSLLNLNQSTLPPKLCHVARVLQVHPQTVKRDYQSMGWRIPTRRGRRRGEQRKRVKP